MKMDKNTLIGFLLMALVVFGFMAYENHTRKEQLIEQQQQAVLNQATEQKKLQAEAIEAEKKAKQEIAEKTDTLNPLFLARQENEGTTVIENELLKLTISNKGGKLCKAELKDDTYKSRDGGNVILFDKSDYSMNLMFSGKEHNILTEELYFTPTDASNSSVTMKLPVAEGSIDISYSLVPESYILNMNVQANNISGFFPAKSGSFDIIWNERIRQQEKGYSFENQHSTIAYRSVKNSTDNLSSTGADEFEDEFKDPIRWIAFKNQFFSQVLIANESFQVDTISSYRLKEGSGYLKTYGAALSAKFDPSGKTSTDMKMYLGPNKFSTLKDNEELCENSADLDLQSLVYLGWPVINLINRFFMVYLFDFMTGWGINMGIVLLLLTIFIKILVFPLMRKSYLSSANMRVLRPKIDEISARYPKPEDAMMKQQEIMKLYSQYGVSPMGGCLPMLIQMPIWIALFNFIPNAIELRGESFLWADDLSTYDDVIRWNFHIWGIGDHLSLFCILWCVATVLNSWFTMRQQRDSMTPEQQQQMSMMKWMTYLMPVIFFFSFNGYSSGLNYYYFISSIIGVAMMWYLRKTTDDAKLLEKLEARYRERKQNPKKSSGMMEKFQAMQEKQMEILRQQQMQQQNKK